ncbi:MAG: ubiquinol-cytochrome C chaperone [Nitratireductor sp.]|nr:ubiquinol-cytochrome C chaperone [Nitratireductor sp.]MCB1456631.1 ubiquinol-cytochrome C chaperone [Nitratireductor sp.]MCB1459647.1 ubiquinol-cytochrome C chaperone [Nitratireductor sp.]
MPIAPISRFLAGLRNASPLDIVSQEIYGRVMAQARNAAFFTRYGFEDTVVGRFDLLSLHMFLFSHRLAAEADTDSSLLGQKVFDIFTAETDRALREIGIGDTSVPKRKKAMIRGFYAQVSEFADPLTARDADAMASVLASRFAGAGEDAIRRLASYMFEAADMLAGIPLADIGKGRLAWPDPA